MHNDENLDVTFLAPGQDTARCAVCNAQGDIYELRIGRSATRLCHECLDQITKRISHAIKGRDAIRRIPAGTRELLGLVLDGAHRPAQDPEGYAAQCLRLGMAKDAIPDAGTYLAVTGRFFQDPEFQGDLAGKDSPVLVQKGIDYLKAPARAEYIAYGATDLKALFPQDMLPWLFANKIYVAADLAYLSDQKIMAIPGITPREVSLLYQNREEWLADHDDGRPGSKPTDAHNDDDDEEYDYG